MNIINKKTAQQIVDTVKDVCGHNINFINENGMIIASTDLTRIGTFHEGGKQVIKTGIPLEVYEDNSLSGTQKGVNIPVAHNGILTAVIGISGEPDEVRSYAYLAEKITRLLIREQELNDASRTQTEKKTYLIQTLLNGNIENPEYIQKMLKFYIDRFVIDLCDTAKMEDMTFVIYGNPRYISLLDPEINWVVKSGDSVGGVKCNYSYGVMNAGGLKIQVVSTMKYDSKDERKLRFIPYPMSADQFTFKHYKYTTHILTAQNSGYRPANRPGGSMTYLMGTTRNTTASIQGIQGSISFENTPFILSK